MFSGLDVRQRLANLISSINGALAVGRSAAAAYSNDIVVGNSSNLLAQPGGVGGNIIIGSGINYYGATSPVVVMGTNLGINAYGGGYAFPTTPSIIIGNGHTGSPGSYMFGDSCNNGTTSQCFIHGLNAAGNTQGQWAYASGKFSTIGDRQIGTYVGMGTTTGTTPHLLSFGSGGGMSINVNSGQSMSLKITVIVTDQTTAANVAILDTTVAGIASCTVSTTAAVTSPVLGSQVAQNGWNLTGVGVTASNGGSYNCVGFTVTPPSGTPTGRVLHWLARVDTVEITG
jgi:hypothetical protein